MDRYVGIIVKSKDIYCLLCELKELGWESLRETSINRLIYLSSVLYSFINNEIENIFAKSYQFTITLSGPEDAEIEKALIHLESNGLVQHTDKGYAVIEGTNPLIIDEEYEENAAEIFMKYLEKPNSLILTSNLNNSTFITQILNRAKNRKILNLLKYGKLSLVQKNHDILKKLSDEIEEKYNG